jgi:glucose uptake protein GlcU
MNFSPDLSPGLAVFMVLFAASMWGTWFISLKYLGDYPIDGFYVTLFTTSVIFVWSVGFLLDGRALLQNMHDVYAVDPSRIIVTLICGSLYVIGMRVTLHVFSTIGLSLTMPIKSSFSILLSTFVAAFVGGVPEGTSLGLIFVACFLLIGAVLLSMQSGRLRIAGQETAEEKSKLQFTLEDMRKSIILLLITTVISPAYVFGLSYGLKSITQPNGLAVLPYMALLSSGAFIGSMIASGGILTIRRQWKKIFSAPMSIHKFGIISGLFHYGGNIIHTFASAFLSTVIAFPLGLWSTLVTQLWGVVYGEFKGSPKKAYYYFGGAFGLYIIGAYIIAQMNF